MPEKPLVLSLFSGIGMFDLAARWAGFETEAFCEIDPFCRAVLAKNFPGKVIHDDIRELDASIYRGRISLLVGGFPCQQLSVAGKQEGLGTAASPTERSGLWFDMLRVIREVQPLFCVVENVPNLRTRGADTVLKGLEEAGYAAECFVVGADDVGAPHRRKRVWIVAYCMADADSIRRDVQQETGGVSCSCQDEGRVLESQGAHNELADTGRGTVQASCDCQHDGSEDREREPVEPGSDCPGLADTESGEDRRRVFSGIPPYAGANSQWPPAPGDSEGWSRVDREFWPIEPEVRAEAHGSPGRLVRRRRNLILKSLGNALVPQVAYLFLKYIREAMGDVPA
jgi:DNA (cytosine-5)-methyltransferase 1